MPKGRPTIEAHAMTAMFQNFVQTLTAAVKDKVTQTVSKATEDFLTGRVAQTVKSAAGRLPRRLRRRPTSPSYSAKASSDKGLRRVNRRSKKVAAPRPGYSKRPRPHSGH